MRVGKGFMGFKTHSSHTQKLFSYKKWKKEIGEIRWNDLHFYIADTCEAMPQQGSWDYFELGPEGVANVFSDGVTSLGGC